MEFIISVSTGVLEVLKSDDIVYLLQSLSQNVKVTSVKKKMVDAF